MENWNLVYKVAFYSILKPCQRRRRLISAGLNHRLETVCAIALLLLTSHNQVKNSPLLLKPCALATSLRASSPWISRQRWKQFSPGKFPPLQEIFPPFCSKSSTSNLPRALAIVIFLNVISFVLGMREFRMRSPRVFDLPLQGRDHRPGPALPKATPDESRCLEFGVLAIAEPQLCNGRGMEVDDRQTGAFDGGFRFAQRLFYDVGRGVITVEADDVSDAFLMKEWDRLGVEVLGPNTAFVIRRG